MTDSLLLRGTGSDRKNPPTLDGLPGRNGSIEAVLFSVSEDALRSYLPEREIVTAAGPVLVQVPKVRDRSHPGIKFNSTLVSTLSTKVAAGDHARYATARPVTVLDELVTDSFH